MVPSVDLPRPAPATACVVGAGNAAHVAAALIAALPGWRCRVYAPRKDRARRWREGLAQGGVEVHTRLAAGEARRRGTPERVSKRAEAVIPGCQILLLCLPAHAIDEHLQAIAPHIDAGALVGSLGGSSGVDWCVDAAMAAVGRGPESYGVFSLVNLPWVCRIAEYGRRVEVKAVKGPMALAVRPSARRAEVTALLDRIIGSPCTQATGGFLEVGLANICQVIHPFIMYDNFADWDGRTPWAEVPLFYQGLSPRAAGLIERASDELIAVRDALTAHLVGLDLRAVRHVRDWLPWAYGGLIADGRTLHTSFVSNAAYAGLRCPMRRVPGGFVPDFTHRYLAEDVPCNLVALRGLAQMCGVATPTIDEVLSWAQRVLGLRLLEGGRLCEDDLAATLAPQRFGLWRPEDLRGRRPVHPDANPPGGALPDPPRRQGRPGAASTPAS